MARHLPHRPPGPGAIVFRGWLWAGLVLAGSAVGVFVGQMIADSML